MQLCYQKILEVIDFWTVILCNPNTWNIDLSSWQVGLLLPTTISLRIPFPLTVGQSRLGWVMGFGNRHKKKEIGCSHAQRDLSSHIQNRHKQDREWKCAARQCSRQINLVRVAKDIKGEARLSTLNVFVDREDCEGMYPTYRMPAASLCWLCCLLWQPFGSSSKRIDMNEEPGPLVCGVCRRKCVGPAPRSGHTL